MDLEDDKFLAAFIEEWRKRGAMFSV